MLPWTHHPSSLSLGLLVFTRDLTGRVLTFAVQETRPTAMQQARALHGGEGSFPREVFINSARLAQLGSTDHFIPLDNKVNQACTSPEEFSGRYSPGCGQREWCNEVGPQL